MLQVKAVSDEAARREAALAAAADSAVAAADGRVDAATILLPSSVVSGEGSEG